MLDRDSRLRRDGDGSGRCRDGNRRRSDAGLLDGCLDWLSRGLLDRCLDRLRRRLLLSLCLYLGLRLCLLGLRSGMGSSSATLSTSRWGRGRCWLGSRLLLDLLGFVFYLRSLNRGRLRRMLLQSLLHGLLLLLLGLLLRDVLLLVLLLHVLLVMLPWMLRMLSGVLSMGCVLMLRVLLLLGSVLRHGHGGLEGAWMLLMVLLGRSLRSVGTSVVDRLVTTTHIGLSLRMSVVLLLAIPGTVSSERRWVLCLHRHRGLRLRRPCRWLLLNNPPLLH